MDAVHATRGEVGPMLFDSLRSQPADPLLGLIRLANADERPGRIDLGVGVYRDAEGRTPILRAVKAAERILLETQETKAYLGPEGDMAFVELIRPLLLGDALARDERIVGVQTPGGCGALLAQVATSKAVSRAVLYTTTDAGRTWTSAAAPAAGEVSMEPGGRIRLAGGANGDELHTTLDGRTWTRSPGGATATW